MYVGISYRRNRFVSTKIHMHSCFRKSAVSVPDGVRRALTSSPGSTEIKKSDRPILEPFRRARRVIWLVTT